MNNADSRDKRRAQTHIDPRLPAPSPHDSTASYAQHSGQKSQSSPTLKPGDRVGRYLLVDEIGSGGFGRVWKAADDKANRFVALKVPRWEHFDEDLLESFSVEVRTLGRLDHRHILPLYDYGLTQGHCFLVSKLASGGTLRERLESAAKSRGSQWPDEAEAIEIVIALAEALQYAHGLDVYHRDIKPGNIFFDSRQHVYLGDFGLALHRSEQHAEAADIRGTVKYMSPEQALGNSHFVDSRSDLYSLGVVFYELLTGRLPFEANDDAGYLRQVAEREVPPLRSYAPRIPAELEQICFQCLALKMTERYSSAADLIAALTAYQNQTTKRVAAAMGSGGPESLNSPSRPANRRDVLKWLAGGSGAAAAGALAWLAFKPNEGRSRVRLGDENHVNNLQPAAINPPREAVVNLSEQQIRVTPLPWRADDAPIWDVSQNGSHLSAFCRDLALFSFGEHTHGVTTLEFQMPVEHTSGEVGLFWGSPQPEGRFRTGHHLIIKSIEDRLYRFCAGSFRLPIRQPAMSNRLCIADRPDQTLPPSLINFEITFNAERFLNLKVGDAKTESLLQRIHRHLAGDKNPTPCVGHFGVFCNGTNLTLLNPRLNDQQVTMQKP